MGYNKSWRSDYRTSFYDTISDIVADPDVQQLRRFHQHGSVTRFDHSIKVAARSYYLCRLFRLDGAAAARGGMLHDFYLYGSSDVPAWRHLMSHPQWALESAKSKFELSEREENIIESHMWPLATKRPRYAEAYIVDLVDTVSAVGEYARRLIPKYRKQYKQYKLAAQQV